jgi:hypothetical protein
LRFHLGPVPEDPDFDPEAEGWVRLGEPRPSALLLAAIPLGIVMGGLAALVWSPLVPLEVPRAAFSLTISLPGLLAGLAALAGFIALHESLHALPTLVAGSPDAVTVGFWPRHLAPYVSYAGALSRETQLLSGVAPFVLLTVLPVAVAIVAPASAQLMRALSVLNALGSGADLIMLGLIMRQVPRRAAVRNQGFSTWWRCAV